MLFVAVLASGLVHAHEREEAGCEEADDCSEGECPEPVCGPAHHCGCCSPLVVTCSAAVAVVPAAVHAMAAVHRGGADARPGVRSRVERPPRG